MKWAYYVGEAFSRFTFPPPCASGQAEIFAFTQHYGRDYAPNSYHTSNLTMAATKAYTPGEFSFERRLQWVWRMRI